MDYKEFFEKYKDDYTSNSFVDFETLYQMFKQRLIDEIYTQPADLREYGIKDKHKEILKEAFGKIGGIRL